MFLRRASKNDVLHGIVLRTAKAVLKQLTLFTELNGELTDGRQYMNNLENFNGGF